MDTRQALLSRRSASLKEANANGQCRRVLRRRPHVGRCQFLLCIETKELAPINVPTAGAQAFPMDGIGRLGHDPPRGPSADWWVLTTANAAGTNGSTCLPKHGGARDSKYLVTHPMTDHCENETNIFFGERGAQPCEYVCSKITPTQKRKNEYASMYNTNPYSPG
ncbi:hypothetical protein evm_013822, partial [Chilo suppressalis]